MVSHNQDAGRPLEETLAEALEHFSDPTQWRRFLAVEAICLSQEVVLTHLGSPMLSLDGGDEEYRKLRATLEAERGTIESSFVRRLRDGAIAATAYRHPIASNPDRIAIPSDQWAFLRLNFVDSRASGPGLHYIGVLVSERAMADGAPSAKVQPPVRQPRSRPKQEKVDIFVKQFVAQEQSAGRTPSEQNIIDAAAAALNARRDQVRPARKKVMEVPGKGRPRKNRQK